MSSQSLHLQTFLRQGGLFAELAKTYRVVATRHKTHPNLIQFLYERDAKFHHPLTREARGIILDGSKHYNVVARAMDKFPNYEHGEQFAPPLNWTSTRAFEKVDGSLVILYAYDNEWHFATSGFPDASGKVGDYGFSFNELIRKTFNDFPWNGKLPNTTCNITFWFELTSPFNKICVLQDKPALTLLGARDLWTQKELSLELASTFFPNCPVVKTSPMRSVDDVLATLPTMDGLKQEGYVLCDAFFNRRKVKCASYLRLHMLRDTLSSMRGIVDVVRNGQLDASIDAFPELKDTLIDTHSRYSNLLEELHTTYDRIKDVESSRDFALAAMKTACSSALFAMRHNKVASFEEHIRTLHVDTVMHLLGVRARK